MNMKMKALVVATAMAMSAQAQAAINTDGGEFSAGDGTGAGELFLSVIDRGGAVQRSFVLDLGISAAAYRANEASYFSGGANALNITGSNLTNLQNFLSSPSGTIGWNITAIDSRGNANSDFENLGYLSTSANPLVANSGTVQGFVGLGGAIQKASLYASSVNGRISGAGGSDVALNESVTVPSSAGNAYHDTGFGSSWSTAHATEGALGDSLGFYFVGLNLADPDFLTSRVDTMQGKWSLSSTGLSLSAAVVPPAIPVPAAVWLLGSALVGLVGVARRKSEQAIIS